MASFTPVPVFKNVAYWISEPIDEAERQQAEKNLRKGGAKRATSTADASHIITESMGFFGYDDAYIDAHRVTPVWVKQCSRSGYLMNAKYYSPDRSKIMSGIAIHSTDLPENDVEIMAAAVHALGGQWKPSLTKDVTHLITLAPEGSKYSSVMGMKRAGTSDIEVVVPAWLMDCIALNQIIPTGLYAFPEPEIYRQGGNLRTIPGEAHNRRGFAPSDEQSSIFHTTLIASGEKIQKNPRRSKIWDKRQFILCSDLGATPDVLLTLEASITNNGGLIVHELADCDILICRYRYGDAFEDAVGRQLIVATVPWVFHCEKMGRLTLPAEEFLHYPIPPVPVVDFAKQKITVTNYTGEAREYLKKLIEAMGGIFSPCLSSSTTKVVIAAELSGKKVQSAKDRRIPIVNHLWLEECFLLWKIVPIGGVAAQAFSKFPTGLSFGDLLGRRRGFLAAPIENNDPSIIRGDPKSLEEFEQQKNAPQQPSGNTQSRSQSVSGPPTHRNATHGVDANEGNNPRQTGRQSPLADNAPSSSRYNLPPDDLDIEMAEDNDAPSVQARALAKVKPFMAKQLTPRETSAAVQDDNSDGELDVEFPDVLRVKKRVGSSNSSSNLRDSSTVSSAASSHPKPKATRIYAAPSDPDLSREESPDNAKSKTSKNSRARASSAGDTSRASSPAEDEDSTMQSKSMLEEQAASGSRPRRGAAARADENLRNIVMPDVLQHEKDMKASHGDVRKWTQKEEARVKKRNRDEEDSEDGVDEHQSSNARRSNGKGRPSDSHLPKRGRMKASAQELEEDLDSGDQGSDANKDDRRHSGKQNSQKKDDAERVIIMTTKYNMNTREEEALRLLGAKMTDDPMKCTYLVTPSMVRTVKFICVLAKGRHIVHPDWVTRSIKAKKLLPPHDFQLNDEAGEERLECNLSESLRRARTRDSRKLFEGHEFWISAKAGLSLDDLKKVVIACGGKVMIDGPKTRLLKNEHARNRHVVSALDDKAYWEGLAEDGIRIYSKEIILDSAFKQKVDWEEHIIA